MNSFDILMTASKFSVNGMISSMNDIFSNWASATIFMLGAIMLLVGIIGVARYVLAATKGRQGPSLPLNLAILLIGAVFIIGAGMINVGKIGNIARNDLNNMVTIVISDDMFCS